MITICIKCPQVLQYCTQGTHFSGSFCCNSYLQKCLTITLLMNHRFVRMWEKSARPKHTTNHQTKSCQPKPEKWAVEKWKPGMLWEKKKYIAFRSQIRKQEIPKLSRTIRKEIKKCFLISKNPLVLIKNKV